MKLKKILALVLAIACVLSLASCNPGTEGTSTEPGGMQQSGITPSGGVNLGETDDVDLSGSASISATDVAAGSHGIDWRDYELDENQTLTLVNTWSTATTLDPNDSTASVQWTVFQAIGEGLFRVYGNPDSTQQLEHAGAESHTISEDGLTYTFKIRENHWSDGVKVTAQDYAFSIRRLLDPEQAFGYASYMFVIKNAAAYYSGACSIDEVGIETPDESTLVITLEQATPYFIEMCGMVPIYPIREDVIAAAPDEITWQTDFKYHVFNGPFIITEFIDDNRMTLAPNPHYWDAENIKLTQVNLIDISEVATQALMFENKQLDIIAGSAEFISRWSTEAQNGTYTQLVLGRPQTAVISFNQYARDDAAETGRPLGGSSGLMLNTKCRLAISLAVDRQELIETVHSRYTVAGGYIPRGMSLDGTNFREAVPDTYISDLQAQYDTPEKIRALFEEGMAEEGMTGGAESVTLKLLATSKTTALEFYQQNIAAVLGCTVELNIVDATMYRAEQDSGDWDLLAWSWIGDYDDPYTMMFLWTSDSNYYNYFGGFNNEEFDRLVYAANASSDSTERLALYAQAEKILIEEAGVAPMYYGDTIYFYHPYVYNFNVPQVNPADFTRAFIVAHD